MDIRHRVSLASKYGADNALQTLGIAFKKNVFSNGSSTMHFVMNESDSRWPAVAAIIQQKHGFDWVNTVFDRTEILNAEWVRLMCAFECDGNPVPKQGYEYLTYEYVCPKCKKGYRQKAPFRLSEEPTLGTSLFFCFLGVDDLFCTDDVLRKLQERGIGGHRTWPVFIESTGQNSPRVSQLVFPTVAEPAVIEDEKANPRTCFGCGNTAYDYVRRGYMHLRRGALATGVDCQLSHEWFGGAKFREMLISHRFARIIIENEWSGVSLKPVQLV